MGTVNQWGRALEGRRPSKGK